MSYLLVDRSRCTGCRVCETICSVTKAGAVNRARSRIRVYRLDVLKLALRVCLQCRRPPCLAACPQQAIIQYDGKVRVLTEVCNGCGACLRVCDRLFLRPETDVVVMCDQCGACIPECPEEALSIKD